MKLNLLSLAYLLVVCFSCTQKESNKTNIYLDLSSIIDTEQITEFDEIGTISDAIELAKDTIIGQVEQVELTDKGIFILDNNYNLYKLSKKGELITQISNKGNGPREYNGIVHSFTVSDDGTVYLLSNSNEILSVKVDIIIIDKFKNNIISISAVGNDLIGLANLEYLKESGAPLIYSIDNNGFKSSVLAKSKDDINLDFPLPFGFYGKGDNSFYYKEELSDSVYAYKNKSIDLAYILDLKDYKFTRDLYDWNKIDKWDNHYRVISLSQSNKLLLFTLQQGLMGGIFYILIDNTSGNKFFFSTPTIDGVKFTPKFINENKLYAIVSPVDILTAKVKPTNTILKSINEDDNDILIAVEID